MDQWEVERVHFADHIKQLGVDSFLWWPTSHKTIVTGGNHPALRPVIGWLVAQPEWRDGLRDIVMHLPPTLMSGPEGVYATVGGMRTIGTELLQAYYFLLFKRAFPNFENMSILEFGGGYGSFSRICKWMGHAGRYVIYDLPELIQIQQYVLRECGVNSVEHRQYPYRLAIGQFDAMVSICALSETPVEPALQGWIGRAEFMLSSMQAAFVVYQAAFFDVDNRSFFSRFNGERGMLLSGHELHVAGGLPLGTLGTGVTPFV